MDAQRFQRLCELLENALELDDGQRARLLAQVARDEPDLHAELAAALAADASAQPLLDRALVSRDGEATELPAAGLSIGPYRLRECLGRGGMGEVWLAVRVQGEFAQTVALKLIRPGFDSRVVRERFLRERQILANLNHPHIARLLDGGTTATGQPWFALEYVEGEPITLHARALALRDRLRLFVRVCRAVQFAHARLVIHRDLKPANILVTANSEPRLLDFGIASLLSDPAGSAGNTALTELSGRAATPEYASPEQLAGGIVTTASDVYALGVVLYELLTGRRCAGNADAPTRPSAVASDQAQRRALRGDLDTIVLAALAAQPERRYPSAEALADDIERHLTHLPVLARRDSVAYRAGKFLQRHWIGAAATALVFAGLAGGFGIALWQVGVAREQSQRAEAVSAFLTELFESNDPDRAQGATVTARELLDHGARRVEDGLAGAPDLGIALMGVIGSLYADLGAYDASEKLLERRLQAARQRYGADDLRSLRAEVDRAGLDNRRYRFESARAPLQHALAGFAQRDPGSADHAEALLELARVEHETGHREDAERDYRTAQAIRRDVFGANDHRTASVAVDIAGIEEELGRYAEAEATMRAAIAILDADPATPLSSRSQARFRLAAIEKDRGHPEQAEILLREILPLVRQAWGENHVRVADVLHDLAITVRAQGDVTASLDLQQQALAIYRADYGDSVATATALHDLASTMVLLDRPREADPLLDEAARMYRAKLGDAHEYVAMVITTQARAARRAGDPLRAQVLFRDALLRYARALPATSPVIQNPRDGLAEVLLESGQPAAAEPLEREVIARWREQLGADDHRTVSAELVLARILIALDRADEARDVLSHAAPVLSRKFGADNPKAALARALSSSLDAQAQQ